MGKKAKGGKGEKVKEEPPSPYPPRMAIELATLRPFDLAVLRSFGTCPETPPTAMPLFPQTPPHHSTPI